MESLKAEVRQPEFKLWDVVDNGKIKRARIDKPLDLVITGIFWDGDAWAYYAACGEAKKTLPTSNPQPKFPLWTSVAEIGGITKGQVTGYYWSSEVAYFAGFCLHPGFYYYITDEHQNQIEMSEIILKEAAL